MQIALDATYGATAEPTGVGVYTRELIAHLPLAATPGSRLTLAYRAHRLRQGFAAPAPPACRRTLLTEWGPLARYDVFHGLNQRLPKRRLRRSVVTFHDLFVMTREYSTPEFRARFTEQARHAAQHADLIIAVSAFTAGQVVSLLGIELARVRVVHHGVTPPAAFRDTQREPLILHTGVIQARKNIVRLLEAFEAAPPEWTLALAGAADGYGAAEILARIERSPARHRIRVPGYVPQAELEALYAKASIFAFPSLDEGFGMPVLDAMARGVPVLTSNASALAEVAGGAALLVDPADTASVCAGLLRLCEQEELRGALKKAGYERAACFSWQAAAEKTWEIYRELL